MYDELVKALRFIAKQQCRVEGEQTAICDIAADAIEQLTADLERSKEWEAFWKEQAEEAKGKLQQYALAVANKPRWIPVTERLPEKYHQVLVYGKNGFQIDYYAGAQSVCGNPLFMVSEAKATHWMPLPEPPKEE